MLQTKIFLSDTDGDPSDFCKAADQFNTWVAENPNVVIEDVQYQHTSSLDNYDNNYILQASSIMVLFEVSDDAELKPQNEWHSVWDRRSIFEKEMKDESWIAEQRQKEFTFPLVGDLPSLYKPVLVKLSDGSYLVSQVMLSVRHGYYFEGILDCESFSWQYLPE